MNSLEDLKPMDINQGVEECRATKGAVLLDVRTKEEYKDGRLPESKNIPFYDLAKVESVIINKSTPLYVHCRNGERSRQAVTILKSIGYINVKDIGGISAYRGRLVQ